MQDRFDDQAIRELQRRIDESTRALELYKQFDHVLLEQSTHLIQSVGPEIDTVIDETLLRIGELIHVARAYVFRFNDFAATMTNTHEWCSPDVAPQIGELQDLPQSMFPEWMKHLRSGRPIYLPDVSSLPDDWKAEREILEMQSVCSILVVPVAASGRLFGFAGFDVVTPGFEWREEYRQMLHRFANNIGAVWASEDSRQNLLEAMRVAHELAQREQSASRQKSAFLSNISHEIRSPLNAVVGLTHLLLDTPLTGAQRRQVEGIRAGGSAILKLVNNILELSRIESGIVEAMAAPFRLGELVRELEAVFTFQAVAKGLAASFGIDADVPDALIGDAMRLGQILTNLLANAIKFSQQGTVRLHVSLLERLDDRCVLCLEVSDEGVGLSEGDIERIFQPYWQSGASVRTEHRGSGLGLSISRQLCELIGGTIAVRSAPGHGSTFIVRLPCQLDRNADTRHVAVDGVSSQQGCFDARVLVVEDIEINREIAASLLGRLGIVADMAVDGAQALAMVQEQDYDAVLMDVQMPLMDGLEATGRIRELGGTYDGLPIIALTAHALEEEQVRCLEAGMNDLITKPIDPDRLLKVLTRWLPRCGNLII